MHYVHRRFKRFYLCLHQVVLLLSTLRGVVAPCIAAFRSTWQRSRQAHSAALAAPEVQGKVRQQRYNDSVNMDTKEEDKRIPAFDGRLDQYRDYRKRALLYLHGLEDTKQALAAPRLISNLSGSAFECFRERDPGAYRHADGVAQMLAVLDSRFQFTPEQEQSDWLENCLFRMRRNRNEETTAFTTRFETTLSKVEELITMEQKQERKLKNDMAKAEYRRQSLDYMVALQAHNAQVSALPEGATAPPAPIAPTPPAEQGDVKPFTFPEVVKGFLYLRHVGVSLQTRASLLRSSGGSLRYDKVAELLRKTELDAMVATRGATGTVHGFLAEEEDEPYDGEDWPSDDDYGDVDEYGGYAEDDEAESPEDDPEELEEADEEYDSAMLGYLDARKKLMALRKARGFKEPADSGSHGKPSSSKGTKSRSTSSSTGKGRDFLWKDPGRRSDRPSSSGKGSRHRQKTPPPPRKGKGSSRGRGQQQHRRQPPRREPTGAQYLGMAVAPEVAAPTVSFAPAFSFMVTHDGDAPQYEYSFASHSVRSSVTAKVEQCLRLDRSLGLGVSDSVRDACFLAVPPGHAILDTGCTSTLVGAENERLWNEELARVSGGNLKPTKEPSDLRFEGINGESKAAYRVRYPVRIGAQDGYVQASVIPGKAPGSPSNEGSLGLRNRHPGYSWDWQDRVAGERCGSLYPAPSQFRRAVGGIL